VVKVFNCAKADKNEIMTEVFKSRAVAVGSPTNGNDILSSVDGWIHFLKTLKFKNKKAATFGCYGWSGESVKILKESMSDAGFEVIEESISSLWNPDEEDFSQAKALVESLLK
jgi:flavorubredoxin